MYFQVLIKNQTNLIWCKICHETEFPGVVYSSYKDLFKHLFKLFQEMECFYNSSNVMLFKGKWGQTDALNSVSIKCILYLHINNSTQGLYGTKHWVKGSALGYFLMRVLLHRLFVWNKSWFATSDRCKLPSMLVKKMRPPIGKNPNPALPDSAVVILYQIYEMSLKQPCLSNWELCLFHLSKKKKIYIYIYVS